MWELLIRAIGRPELPVQRGLVFDTAQLAVQYALSGEGLALVDPMLFRDDIAAGRLVCPFETRLSSGYGYYLVTAPEDLDEAVAVFRSWLIRRFAEASPDAATPAGTTPGGPPGMLQP
jgi:DNA-binding transcriptional LysR family regulator